MSLNLFSLPFNVWGATTLECSSAVPLNSLVFNKEKRTLFVGRHAWYALMFRIENRPVNKKDSYPLDHIDEAFEQCKIVAMDYIESMINATVREALKTSPKELIDLFFEKNILLLEDAL